MRSLTVTIFLFLFISCSSSTEVFEYEIYSDDFFDTVTVLTKEKTEQIFQNALSQKVNIRKVNSKMLAVSFDEKKNV